LIDGTCFKLALDASKLAAGGSSSRRRLCSPLLQLLLQPLQLNRRRRLEALELFNLCREVRFAVPQSVARWGWRGGMAWVVYFGLEGTFCFERKENEASIQPKILRVGNYKDRRVIRI
jgi:hypothetical protein